MLYQDDELPLIGDGRAEGRGDVEIQDEAGRKTTAKLPEGVDGIAKLDSLGARHGGGTRIGPA